MKTDMITIRYFGIIRELVAQETEMMANPLYSDTDQLLNGLRNRGGVWAEALAPQRIFRIAVNQRMVFDTVLIKDGDEIAILPPVTGG